MLPNNFQEMIRKINSRHHRFVCVGLDIVVERLPTGISHDIAGVELFIRTIIDATADYAAAYKPNLAFFLALGVEGYALLSRLRQIIPPNVLLVGDAKWGDIGNTASMYAEVAFHKLHFDAVTVNPYQGSDAIEPFLTDPKHGAFVLCRTSNASSPELQGQGKNALFTTVARMADRWNSNNNCGLVVGASDPEELGVVHALAPSLPLLIPGIGAQGGDLKTCMEQLHCWSQSGLLVNSSRSILYGDNGPNYPKHAGGATAELNDSIRRHLADPQE